VYLVSNRTPFQSRKIRLQLLSHPRRHFKHHCNDPNPTWSTCHLRTCTARENSITRWKTTLAPRTSGEERPLTFCTGDMRRCMNDMTLEFEGHQNVRVCCLRTEEGLHHHLCGLRHHWRSVSCFAFAHRFLQSVSQWFVWSRAICTDDLRPQHRFSYFTSQQYHSSSLCMWSTVGD